MTDILAELLARPIPDTLYHYTTQAGIIGIVDGGEIWATHSQYLNDQHEYVHALALVREEIANRIGLAATEAESSALGQMLAATQQKPESINVCVCSFSEDGDSPSQWRAYCEAAAGFAIGFYGGFLAQQAKQEGFYLAPCLYEAEDQVTLVKTFVAKVLAEILAYGDVQPEDDSFYKKTHGGNLIAYLHRVAPTLKDRAFRDEREWRVISCPLMCTNDRFSFRPGASVVTPFYRVAIRNHSDHSGTPRIRRIVIGPTPNTELAKQSVRSLLARENLQNSFTPGGVVAVDDSTVPYRA